MILKEAFLLTMKSSFPRFVYIAEMGKDDEISTINSPVSSFSASATLGSRLKQWKREISSGETTQSKEKFSLAFISLASA